MLELEIRADAHDDATNGAFNDIAKACGYAEWEDPGQLVRDVRMMGDVRDAALETITKIEMVLPTLFSQRQKSINERVEDLVANRDTWYQTALDERAVVRKLEAENAKLQARVTELEKDRDKYRDEAGAYRDACEGIPAASPRTLRTALREAREVIDKLRAEKATLLARVAELDARTVGNTLLGHGHLADPCDELHGSQKRRKDTESQ